MEFCKTTITDVSPEGYEANPIISDFKSMYGVNGRTRMQIHMGIDIIGNANQPIIAIADGKVLEIEEKLCEGPSVVIDHGKSMSGERLIAIYTHTGEFLVKAGDNVKRGMPVAKLPKKIVAYLFAVFFLVSKLLKSSFFERARILLLIDLTRYS